MKTLIERSVKSAVKCHVGLSGGGLWCDGEE
jgi:hypothetical protein